ncbi:hypothetical protein GCK72_002605 [Caenorhabditis remanei]|uniref:Uncharacterized protein n=1 Tax=Caenorhabditis remanei TaxID=31234 RepID=A0A6A5HXN7_CAERE|nr:hypothetical protein GCK72_002605 [Caenorhabditis remanei]KAF1770782.1 hypothetical protein GCK72_002605 [Caenorhabditis remanei]
MTMFERKRAGVDLSNTSVRVCGLRAKVIDTCAEFYLLFTRTLIVLEVSSPYYTDYLILVVFSIIRVGFSSIYSVVLMRLSWCNGLADEDDLEKNKIYECIQEMGIYKCTKCSESEDCDEEENEKID